HSNDQPGGAQLRGGTAPRQSVASLPHGERMPQARLCCTVAGQRPLAGVRFSELEQKQLENYLETRKRLQQADQRLADLSQREKATA
ncbi:MAG TPA: hypothetical protein VIK98_07685, partial [Limnochordales bacterium]